MAWFSSGLGRIAGILTLEAKDSNASLDAIHRVGSSLAMHIVAAKPLFLSKESVSSAALDSERDILKTQVINLLAKGRTSLLRHLGKRNYSSILDC